MTRRGVLAGAAVGLAGVAGVGAMVEQDLLPGRTRAHELLGLNGRDGAVPSVTPGPVRFGRLATALLPDAPEWVVALPPGVESGAALPVVVVLHYAGGSARGLVEGLGLPEFLAASGARMALAAVDGGAHSYWQDHGAAGDPGEMVTQEFLPMLGELGLDVSAPAWLGWSMGGYGVLRLSAQRAADGLPCGPVVAVSPAVWPSYDQTAGGAFADEEQYAAAMSLLDGDPPVETRVDCGTGDPFYRNVVDLTEGHQVETHFEAGDHTRGYWTRVLPDQLSWIAGRTG